MPFYKVRAVVTVAVECVFLDQVTDPRISDRVKVALQDRGIHVNDVEVERYLAEPYSGEPGAAVKAG